ncbi:N-acetyltransferase [Kribbella sp. NPDC023972]|uniref:GNAT family N-acetyltransferase n=1 Tax=Kribbella sp. NPDC023972 TaxID=3154795 RepID=UPI00340B3C25
MFGWEFEVGDSVSGQVYEPGGYGFVDGEYDGDGTGPNGGVGGGPSLQPKALFYVGVDDVGAAPGYGYLADDVPELSLGVSPAFRRQGIARALMTELIRTSPYKRFSLSVDPANPAAALYHSLGFKRSAQSKPPTQCSWSSSRSR